jgi:sugar phosphate isomerase/epimerase
MRPGLNLECARSEGLDFEAALRRAREAGYAVVEPFVYAPVTLAVNSHVTVQTLSPYHHLNTATAEPGRIRALCDALGLSLSALDAHCSLLLPQIGVPAVRRVLDLAAEIGCPLVMSDEGPVPAEWMPLERGFDLLCTSLDAVIAHAQARGVRFAIELHNALTTRPEYLQRLLARYGRAELSVNFDTGNSFLAGNDPVAFVRAVASRVAHVHVKDIPASQLPVRGTVTGTRVGVTVGAGVVDLDGIVGVLAAAGYGGVLSVECDTLEQAAASRPVLTRMIEQATAPQTARGAGSGRQNACQRGCGR